MCFTLKRLLLFWIIFFFLLCLLCRWRGALHYSRYEDDDGRLVDVCSYCHLLIYCQFSCLPHYLTDREFYTVSIELISLLHFLLQSCWILNLLIFLYFLETVFLFDMVQITNLTLQLKIQSGRCNDASDTSKSKLAFSFCQECDLLEPWQRLCKMGGQCTKHDVTIRLRRQGHWHRLKYMQQWEETGDGNQRTLKWKLKGKTTVQIISRGKETQMGGNYTVYI